MRRSGLGDGALKRVPPSGGEGTKPFAEVLSGPLPAEARSKDSRGGLIEQFFVH